MNAATLHQVGMSNRHALTFGQLQPGQAKMGLVGIFKGGPPWKQAQG